MVNGVAAVKRFVYRQIVPGDLRKFDADANDADTGGGARDLRFRPHTTFGPVFADLFPNVRHEMRLRGGVQTPVQICVGAFYWLEHPNVERSREATYEPPTDARPDEGRIPTVHLYPPFDVVPKNDETRLIVLLIQTMDDKVWPHLVTEGELLFRGPGEWDRSVATPVLACLARSDGRTVVRGFVDFVTGAQRCHA